MLSRRTLLATAPALAVALAEGLRPDNAPAQIPDLPAGNRSLLDDGWKFAFGHLNNIHRDFEFGANLRTFAKQGPDSSPAARLQFDDSGWRTLNLPHDWAVELPFDPHPDGAIDTPDKGGFIWSEAAGHGFKPIGRNYPETSVGWYRRMIDIAPADKGKRIRIDFDGVFRSTTVMINGYIVKEHSGGYVPFSVDVTDFLNTDDQPNVLTVRVDASLGEGWFYEGAGIYRHVWMVKHDPVHMAKDGLCIRARADGTVDLVATVRNDSSELQHVTVDFWTDPGPPPGDASVAAILDPHSQKEISLSSTISSPRLWSLDDPFCYVLTARLRDIGGRELDVARSRFGFRDIRFDPEEGFFLNNAPVKIKGTCNHQDHAGIGVAVPDAIWSYRLQCQKDMGCNAIRTAHHPAAPELLDACDRMGMLVLEETRMMSASEAGLDELATMVVRDRNHPSIILWSVGNEEPQQGTPRGARIVQTMKDLVRTLDPTRGITAGMDKRQGEGITQVLDVMGFNYSDDKIDDFHARFPKMPIIGSETSSELATRGEYIKDPIKHLVPAYDNQVPWNNTAEGWWSHFNSKSYIAGGFFWTGFDYRGEATPWQAWPSVSSHFGVLDTCGFPKDTYYYYKAWWWPEPLLHLFPHWNWEPGSTVNVWAHSNCDSVELFVNGKSAGRKTMVKDRHVEWDVPYVPGKIEAFGYRADKVILKSVRETAGPAARIVLTSDRDALAADGRTVPRAANLIVFRVNDLASVIGVGNGNPNCTEPDKAWQRSAYNGLACAIVQMGRNPGNVTIVATADGLAPGKVNLSIA